MADTNYDKVSTLLPMNGANAGTTLIDYSKNQISVYPPFGNGQTSTTQSKYYGSSLSLDGTGDYLYLPIHSDFAFGSGNFTIEAWIYRASTTTNNLIDFRASGTTTNLSMYTSVANDGKFGYYSNAVRIFGSTAVLPLNTWFHLAVCRVGTTVTSYINGLADGTGTDSSNYSTNTAFWLGHDSANQDFNGYIQDFRITKGLARYTSNFVPPTQLCTTVSGVVRDDTNAVAIRTVWSLPRLAPSGAKTTTSASDGTYSLTVPDTLQNIVVLDDSSGVQYNDLIFSQVTPG